MFSLPAQPHADSLVRVVQLDVGQGDAALIVAPGRRHVLIDAGRNADVARALRAMGIDTVHLLISSHNHSDHIGGIADVLANTVVRAYMDNGVPHNTSAYLRAIQAVQMEPGIQYLAAAERTIRLGELTVRVLPPPRRDDSQNNNSVGVLIEFGQFRALYTGDSEVNELSAWLGDGRAQRVTLLKSAHHGALNGATWEWMRATTPKVVVVSVGARNRYGHPAFEILNAWTQVGAEVYRTDMHGTIGIVATRAGNYQVVTEAMTTSRR